MMDIDLTFKWFGRTLGATTRRPTVGALEAHTATHRCAKSHVFSDRAPSGYGKRSREG